jgi:hypothetical protein
LKVRISARKPKDLDELEAMAKEEWAKIPKKTCQKLIESYKTRLEAVIANKGYTIKH